MPHINSISVHSIRMWNSSSLNISVNHTFVKVTYICQKIAGACRSTVMKALTTFKKALITLY